MPEYRIRSVFCKPEEIQLLTEKHKGKKMQRKSCRDQNGNARLMYNVDIMDAVERLCELEDAVFGPLTKDREAAQERAALGGKKSRARAKQKKELEQGA